MESLQGELKDLMTALAEVGYHPSRALGQNFLTDPNLLDAIVREAELTDEDTVLEVGSGSGWLTRRLAARAGRVVSIEIDPRLYEHCAKSLADLSNLTLLHGDALKTKNELNPDLVAAVRRPGGRLKAVANLPYCIGSPFLVLLYESGLRPPLAVVTLQEQVAQRLTAPPGTKAYGPLTVAVGYFARARIVRRIRAGVFWPRPQVHSAVVRLEARSTPPDWDYAAYRQVARALFTHRRKRLAGALRTGLGATAEQVHETLEAAGLDPTLRGECLSIEQIGALSRIATQRGWL